MASSWQAVLVGQRQQVLDAVLGDAALLQVGQEGPGIDLDHRPRLDQTAVARHHQGRRSRDLLGTGEPTFLPDLQDSFVGPGRMLDPTTTHRRCRPCRPGGRPARSGS